MKKEVNSNNAPEPIGPYSQAIAANDMLYVSGQIALDRITGKLVIDNIAAETHQVMKNLHAILSEAGTHFNQVVKCSIFLSDMDDFATVNDIYGQYFEVPAPARETVAVKTLPKSVNVEISCIAIIPS